mmetsp:Transcript_28800/g.92738  ORF Transcript_28800/g.92738 Transcript_28800/m.92738 type:complete len:332 (-) Transcript_28800:104-1099(-)
MAAAQVIAYHVNEYAYGPIPLDMDVSDLGGDVFFDLHAVVLPVECASSLASPMDCANTELDGDDLVVSKLELEVDSRFGDYGRCNTCGAEGIDPFSGLPCPANEYFCTCGSYDDPYECASSKVGVENLTQVFDPAVCTWDIYVAAPWVCWQYNTVGLTGGAWYSMPKEGYCDDSSLDDDDAPCSWRVAKVEKVIAKDCSDRSIDAAVQGHDSSGCFEACGEPLNASSPCYVGCFYKTVLGDGGMLPVQSGDALKGGAMSFDLLKDAWSRPFDSDDPALFGCPPYERSSFDKGANVAPSSKASFKAAALAARRRSNLLRRLQTATLGGGEQW